MCVIARLVQIRFTAQPAAADAVAGTAAQHKNRWPYACVRGLCHSVARLVVATAVRLAIACRVIFGQAGDHAGADSAGACGPPKGSRAERAEPSDGGHCLRCFVVSVSGGACAERIYGLRCGECYWSIGEIGGMSEQSGLLFQTNRGYSSDMD